MAGCINLLGYLENKPGVLSANTTSTDCANNCEGGPELGSGVESVGKPPGKRVRMKQSSFGVISKDGNLVWDLSASNKANMNTSPQKIEGNDEKGGKRKRPMRQCVRSTQVDKKLSDVEEGDEAAVDASNVKNRIRRNYRRKDADSPPKQNEENASVDGNRELTAARRGRGRGKTKAAESPSKQIDGVAMPGKHQCTDCVGACNCLAYIEGLGDEVLLGPTSEFSLKILGKAGMEFSSLTPKKHVLKQLKLKSESQDCGVRNKNSSNAEAPKNILKRQKHAKEAKVDTSYSPKTVSSKKGHSKRKGPLLENSKMDALIDGDGAKLSSASFDLRSEAKQAAEENARLNAGKNTHPFFMQKRSLQTRAVNISETQFEANRQNLKLSETLVAPLPPFHITQNDQMEIAALDWKGWEFVESNIWQQEGSKLFEEAFQAMPEDDIKLLKSGGFSCFLNGSKDSSNAFPCQDVWSQVELTEHSGGLDRKKKQLEKLFAYLENGAKIGEPTLSANLVKDSCSKLSLEDLEQRFISYHFHRSSGMNNMWTDKYQPETSREVCGNSEQVMFLNDWLRCWHERVFGSDKDQTNESDSNVQDEDWGSFQDEEETLSKDGEDGLKNISLLTGPVGCGKSAALYACAKEQGFDVIEVNASDCRSGALVKQKFGEAMESHGLNQRAVEDILGVDDHKIVPENPFSGKETRWKGNAQHKMNKEKHVAIVSGGKNCQISEKGKQIYSMDEKRWTQGRSKALILFEDVDMVFDEDRGFMGALLQIAETAKRPIVLTSNRRDPCLPRLLDRLTIQLELPSLEELVCHVFMICIAEGIIISPSLVEHVLRCCCRDLRKSLMLLQFWCQGKSKSGKASEGQVSHIYSSIPLELDVEHRIMPKMMPWGFPCKLSERINFDISKALDEVQKQACLNEIKFAEERAAKDTLAAQFKKMQKKMNEAEKKAAMLRRLSSDDESMQILRDFENEIDTISKVTQSSVRSLRHRRTVVTSDSEDIDCHETTTAISETQLQDTCKEVPVELMSEPDDMTLSGSDPESFPNWRGRSQETKPTSTVFRRLKKIQGVNYVESSSLIDNSCLPESSVVPETVANYDNECQVKSVDCGNTLECVENSFSNICSPLGVLTELQKLECPNKVEKMLSNTEDNILKSAEVLERSVHHCEKFTDMVGNNDFTTSHTGDASSDVDHLKSKENVDDKKLDLDSHIWSGSLKNSAKHIESSNCERLHDRKGVTAIYEMLPLMDECSRVDFNIINADKNKQENLETENPAQQIWLKMLDSNEDFKSLLDLQCKDALTAINLATKLTDLISSSDLLISSCTPDQKDFFLHEDHVPTSCSDERMEITSTLAQQGLCIMGHNLSNESNLNLHKDILTSSTDSIAMGKLILAQSNDEMVRTDEFSEIDMCPTEQYSKRQETETRLSNALDSLLPNKSFFMAKGIAFHEYTSFLGQISKLEEARVSHATTLKRRARGCHHYLSTGRFSVSQENIHLLAQHSNYGKVSGGNHQNAWQSL
ncbi:uncharacterized protein LOC131079969 isoform X1 [Cryptomeria japonica]|uniref:uncharacterized protein LOC131079969 isoform X1 n=1 Tax=Cryptomeria japonica TaxID=3369 RepID=UPI0027DA8619|nr:uncharacterized protein LOC131079969 isoform X1 [Cryptomeria japonica]